LRNAGDRPPESAAPDYRARRRRAQPAAPAWRRLLASAAAARYIDGRFRPQGLCLSKTMTADNDATLHGRGGSTPGSPFAPSIERPRLRIAHFMLWMACVAVYLSLIRVLHESSVDIPAGWRNLWMLYGLGAGTGLTGLVLGVTWRCRGVRFPTTAGEYLLVIGGVGPLISLGTAAVFWAAMPRYGSSSYRACLLVSMAAGALVAAIWVWAAVKSGVRRWRVYFVLQAIEDLAGQTCLGAMSHMLLGAELFFLLLLALIAIRDRRERWPKPWPHWLGIAVQLWFGVYLMAWRAAMLWRPEWLGLP
jgi:hypothetical protein